MASLYAAIDGAAALPAPRQVLIVDDEPLVLDLVSRILEDHGFETRTAGNGEEAWRCLQQTHQPIDILITDLSMPKLGGRELIDRVMKKSRPPWIVASSGEDDLLKALVKQWGGRIYILAKPYGRRQLIEAIKAGPGQP